RLECLPCIGNAGDALPPLGHTRRTGFVGSQVPQWAGAEENGRAPAGLGLCGLHWWRRQTPPLLYWNGSGERWPEPALHLKPYRSRAQLLRILPDSVGARLHRNPRWTPLG